MSIQWCSGVIKGKLTTGVLGKHFMVHQPLKFPQFVGFSIVPRFRRSACMAFLPRSCSTITFVQHEIVISNISYSRTVWPRITKFYVNIHTDIFYSRTWYDVRHYLLPVGNISEKRNTRLCQNYRTICLICHPTNVMLRVILNRLINKQNRFWKRNKIFHGTDIQLEAIGGKALETSEGALS